jgi:NitT/TauT family transport system substrate-binding protein
MKPRLRRSRRRWSAALLAAGLWLCLGPPCAARAASGAAPLKLALLPIVDALPFFVAESKGYFGPGPTPIVALPVGSALERDQLLQAGAVDGVINEIIGVASFNRERVQLRIVSLARAPAPGHPLFRVLAAPGSRLAACADLADVPVGVSQNTIIEYITDRLLTAGGVPAGAIRKQSVPVIPERFQLLMQGQLRAATLPDPLGFAALAGGALPVSDDGALPQLSFSVLAFTTTALETKSEAVRRFMAGWDRAAAEINAAPEAHRELLLRQIRVPPQVSASYPVPPFPRAQVPTRAAWDDVMAWMVARGLVTGPQEFDQAVTTAYLPPAAGN